MRVYFRRDDVTAADHCIAANQLAASSDARVTGMVRGGTSDAATQTFIFSSFITHAYNCDHCFYFSFLINSPILMLRTCQAGKLAWQESVYTWKAGISAWESTIIIHNIHNMNFATHPSVITQDPVTYTIPP